MSVRSTDEISSSAYVGVLRQGRCLILAWGIAPGIKIADRTSAERAFQSGGSCLVLFMEQMAVRTESRFQPRKFSGLPQVRHGESVLWRTVIERRAFSAKHPPAYCPKVL